MSRSPAVRRGSCSFSAETVGNVTRPHQCRLEAFDYLASAGLPAHFEGIVRSEIAQISKAIVSASVATAARALTVADLS
jgi:hypothetical protein